MGEDGEHCDNYTAISTEYSPHKVVWYSTLTAVSSSL